jgi:serine/threonine-protein kinase
MAAITKVVCPNCGATLKSDQPRRPGKKARCPLCHASFRLPAAVPPPLPEKTNPAPPRDVPPIRNLVWRRPVLAAAWTSLLCLVGLCVLLLLCSRTHAPAATPVAAQDAPVDPNAQLGAQARAILEQNCFRCHGQDDEAEAGVYILDRDKLVAQKKVVPGNPEGSRLVVRLTSAKNPMPPEDESPRPSADDIALIKKWIAAGAPSFTAATGAAKASDAGPMLTAIRDHLLKTPEQDRKFLRYFTLTNVVSDPTQAKNLPLDRTALAKLVNSLSWKKKIVQLRAVNREETIYAIDLRELDWEAPDRWQDIVRAYPYGLRFDRGSNAGLRAISEEIERLTGNALPYVRADWFIAAASRPPLYNTMLALPNNALELERLLGVDLQADFRNGKLRRAGFLKSNVSSQNRLIERHDSRFGAYWKSYDFRSSQNRDSLVNFPLGPSPALIHGHPFPAAAFEQAGGEIIFNLPNGLQGYMLVDGKDNRIDVAPIEVVRDRAETSGTPQIVNGLSCMACHVNGMITGDNVKDVIRAGSAVEGAARDKVEQLYAPAAQMDQLLKKDEERFVRAMKKTVGPPKVADEPVSAVARPFIRKGIDLETAARELGLASPEELKKAILTNRTLRQLGLEPLAQGNAIQRASWEQVQGGLSVFQRVANELGLATPIR